MIETSKEARENEELRQALSDLIRLHYAHIDGMEFWGLLEWEAGIKKAIIALLGIGNQRTQESGGEMKKHMIGEFVIVRCRDAGVHAGTLLDYDGRTAVLKDSRRLWYFKCADSQHTLSGVASAGIDQAESKIPAVVDTIVLTETCEIIATTDRCRKTIMEADVHVVEQ